MAFTQNPVKRNRNIGTKKSGYKRQSKFVIPSPNSKPFYENLISPMYYQQIIDGKKYNFIVEELEKSFCYPCTIEEICDVLSCVPQGDLQGLCLIVLRQPKKKEEMLNPCWGRLIYSFEYEGIKQPAIILESINMDVAIKMKRNKLLLFLKKNLRAWNLREVRFSIVKGI